MARWKALGVAAIAALSFVAVKALPWALGFAGGKYLYQTVMGKPSTATLTTAEVSEQLQSQEFLIFRTIKQEFPADYDEIIRKITDVARSGGGFDQARDVSRLAVVDLRHKYAPLVPSTPESNASEVLRAQLDMLRQVMARESAATCNSYLAKGPGALNTQDHDFMVGMDKIGSTLFLAFGAAKSSGLPAAPASDEEWSLVATAFVAAGGTQADMEAIGSANQAYEGLCPAIAKFYQAALSLEGEAGRHVKTTLIYEIARN